MRWLSVSIEPRELNQPGPLGAGFLWLVFTALVTNRYIAHAHGNMGELRNACEQLPPSVLAALGGPFLLLANFLVGSMSVSIFAGLWEPLAWLPSRRLPRTSGAAGYGVNVIASMLRRSACLGPDAGRRPSPLHLQTHHPSADQRGRPRDAQNVTVATCNRRSGWRSGRLAGRAGGWHRPGERSAG